MREAFNKVTSIVLSRFTITILLVMLQVGYIALLLFRLQNYAWYLGVAFDILAVLAVLFIIWRNSSPAYKISWMILIGVFPALGVACYLLFGNKRPTRKMRSKLEPQDKLHISDLEQCEDLSMIEDDRLRKTAEYIHDVGHYPAWRNSGAKYYPLGDLWFPDLLEDLKKAEHFIFMEYFIIGEGYMWEEILNVLKEKAAEGVDIRLIYDDVGSMKVIPKDFVNQMDAIGIKAINFNPVHPIFSLVYNNRDHRKITVVDGYIGYNGGANIADEYINKEERFGKWKDANIRIEGNAVWNYTVMFLNMWNAFKHEDDDYSVFAPGVYHHGPFDEKPGVVQPYADSPLDSEHIGELTYLEVINQAKDYLYIFTPYLIIDDVMQVALELAAKRGVRITIVTPHIPDKPMIFQLTRSYYDSLLDNGIKIMEYTPGFVHSKVFVADDRLAVVGTVNVDFRSFFFHFECATLLMDTECISDIRKDFEDTFDECQNKIEGAYYKNFFTRLYGAVLRAISPLV